MTSIYLIRHGAYENPDYLFPGSLAGFPLSPAGRKQVEKLATYFVGKPIAAIFASPIQRTRETAEIIAGILKLPITFDDRLMEVRTMLEGTSMAQFDQTNGELSYLPDALAKGAESMEALADRLVGFIEDMRKQYKGKQILVVTHGDPLRFAVMKYKNMPITFANSRTITTPLAGGYRVEFDGSSASPIVTPLPG